MEWDLHIYTVMNQALCPTHLYITSKVILPPCPIYEPLQKKCGQKHIKNVFNIVSRVMKSCIQNHNFF